MSEHDSDSSSESLDPLNLKNEEGWEDLEPDYEAQNVICLFSEEVFDNVPAMLQHCKDKFNFDLVKTRKELGLDFIGTIKLVNYLRAETRNGTPQATVSSPDAFEDDKYLKPVLEDDPLLYNIDDLEEDGDAAEPAFASNEVKDLQQQLQDLQSQFAEYKQQVQQSLQDRFENDESTSKVLNAELSEGAKQDDLPKDHEAREHEYFDSYSYNSIHEIMLKDTVRTDSYRDFIYDNKHLFKDKVVLDVGCGTGILSMFCAKAGAKKVIAVDNSEILGKAKQNVEENGLSDTITCIRGKIEEITLPVQTVDIIVSEWMGYCLFYEAMFDSVIWARDHYLAPDGLLVPSHASLFIAPVADPDLIASHINFWHDVYGFKMTNMLKNIHDDVLIRSLDAKALAGPGTPFLEVDLHTLKVEHLSFKKNFSAKVDGDHDLLDGWVVWFDIFFLSRRGASLPTGSTASDSIKKGTVAFTTGPDAKQTHWEQGTLLIDQNKREPRRIHDGQVIEGNIEYRKRHGKSRGLDIDLQWHSKDGETIQHGQQVWSIG